MSPGVSPSMKGIMPPAPLPPPLLSPLPLPLSLLRLEAYIDVVGMRRRPSRELCIHLEKDLVLVLLIEGDSEIPSGEISLPNAKEL
mmetsp:Transcript_25664/g.35722  ORF Transcript_25664/g.35722 Transcript_25664/m.35722 type:complete len:86 (-) Transcript_25664:115-372(-)